jgi:tetratricopeptide (TPR) repeat protein
LWTVLLAAYSNSFQAGLVFDNAPVIGEDPRIRHASFENAGSIFRGQYWWNNQTSGLYRPLTTLSYLGNYAVLGNEARPPGYHWINFALHAINVALVYALGVAIFAEWAPALALAAIWGLHPLLTESVTNIVGRADLLAALGVLAGLLSYVRAQSAVGARRIAWLVAMVAAQMAGLLSKESAAILPALMLAYDLAWPDRATWRSRGWAYALLSAPFAVFFYLRAAAHAHLLVNFAENPLIAAGFWTARLTAIKVAGEFLWKFLWPASLSADYSYNAVPLFGSGFGEDAKAFLALAILGAAVFWAIRVRRKWKALSFFIAFFVLALIPTSNLVLLIGSIMAERFMYLPSIGLAGCAVIALRASKLPARAAALVTIAIAIGLAARTYARNIDWQDGVTLWTSAIAVSPDAARAHNNLGYEFLHIPGRVPEAIGEYEAALRIRPDYPEAHYNLGNAYLRTGRTLEAVAEFQAAVRSAPAYAEAHNNLGNALLQLGQAPEAIAELESALRLHPEYAEAHNNLGNAFLEIPGKTAEAVAEFRSAVQLSPDYAEAHNNLGNALARIPDRLPEAIGEYQTALRIKPDYAEAHNNLGNARMQMPGGLAGAVAEFRAALRIRPDYAEAHNNLGSALLQSDRLGEAIFEYQAAIRYAPNLADAHFNLGNALLRLPGRTPAAIAEFEAVLRIHPDPEVRRILDRLR